MKLTVDNELIEAARRLGPIIEAGAAETERERRLPRPVMASMTEAGLLRLFTPRSLGGVETDPVTVARVIEEISGFDSAAGWAIMVGSNSGWWCCRLPNEGAEEIYAAGPDALIPTAFHPPMRATEEGDGYRVTGRSPLASCSHEADWIGATAFVMDGDQPRMVGDTPVILFVLCRPEECEVIDTWFSLGMCGTDSCDIALNGVFVPKSRTFPITPTFEPGPHFTGPLYRFPVVGEVVTLIAPAALAVARDALRELYDLAERKTPLGSLKPLRERATVQKEVAKAEGLLRSARLLFYDTLTEAWERTLSGVEVSPEQKADLLMAGSHAVQSSVQIVDAMYGLAGTSAIYKKSKLGRHFRDAQVLRHHGFSSESRFETAGQVYLGVHPEFALVLL
jgi:indole-3-acetate monooxygenase